MVFRKLVVFCCSLWLLGCRVDSTPAPQSSPSVKWGSRLLLWRQAIAQHPELPTQLSRALQSLASPGPFGVASLATQVAHQHTPSPLSTTQLQWASVLLPTTLWRLSSHEVEVRVLFSYQGPVAKLQALGMEITSHTGEVVGGWLPLHSVHTLNSLPQLRAAELSRPLQTHLNVSASMVNAPAARLQYGLDGRGVVVGLIDTGIDYRHPAFRRPDGSTRIVSLLDFSTTSPITGKIPRVFNQSQINSALQENKALGQEDKLGHGTHIAGIAAGNGRMPNNKKANYLGIAPRADLVVVKGLRKGSREFDSADVLQGIAFVHAVAKRLKKPYVVNLSLGGQQGGHDGHSLLERALTTFSGKGKQGQILVASAGNEGQSPIHARGWLDNTQEVELLLKVPARSNKAGEPLRVSLEIWFPEDSQLRVTITPPTGEPAGPFSRSSPAQSLLKRTNSLITLTQHRHSQPIPSRSFSILLSSRELRPLPIGTWKIRLEGKARRFDAWITESRIPDGLSARWATYQTQELLIGVPASSKAVITVGSFNSRSGWLNAEGKVQDRSFPVGHLSDFSSPGPTRDGRPKPEITAPGLFVAAPISGFAFPDTNSQIAGGPYQVSQGTSQAAPHVTGGIALLLQAFPKLDIEQARHLLIRSATTDDHTQGSTTYQKGWGFGKMNLLRAVHTHQKDSPEPVDPKRSTLGVLQTELPADGQTQTAIYLIPKDKEGVAIRRKLNIKLKLAAGTLSPLQAVAPGIYRATLTAPLRPSEETLTATVDGTLLEATHTLHFLSPNRPPNPSGCQCQSAFSPPPTPLWLAFFGLLGLFHLRRKGLRKIK